MLLGKLNEDGSRKVSFVNAMHADCGAILVLHNVLLCLCISPRNSLPVNERLLVAKHLSSINLNSFKQYM